MSLPKIRVGSVMTKQVHTIRAGEPVQTAKEMMSKYGVRHLPVLEGGKLLGVVSDRDFNLVLEIKGAQLGNLAVQEVCSPNVYETHADSDLQKVATEMAEKKFGSAVVTDASSGAVEGILTTTDVCRVLAQVLAGDFEELRG